MYAQLLLQFQADPFKTLHTLLGWSEDMHIVFFRILKLFFNTFYCIFYLDFFVFFFCQLLDTLQWRDMVHGLQFYCQSKTVFTLYSGNGPFFEIFSGQYQPRKHPPPPPPPSKELQNVHAAMNFRLWSIIQSTLVISNSKGLSEILRDIHSSTYQVCRIEEKII